MTLAIHPRDDDKIYAGQVSFHCTTDGGATWSTSQPGHEDVQSIAVSPTGDAVYVANDGGVQKLDSNGANRQSLNRGLVTMQFYRVAVQGNVAVGNADHMGVRGTTDLDAAQPTWERASAGASTYGNNGLENDFVFDDPRTDGRFFLSFEDRHLLRLLYPGTSSTRGLLQFSPQSTALQPFTKVWSNSVVNNQLNYAVGTIAVDPRKDSEIILTAIHVTRKHAVRNRHVPELQRATHRGAVHSMYGISAAGGSGGERVLHEPGDGHGFVYHGLRSRLFARRQYRVQPTRARACVRPPMRMVG